MIVYGIDSTEMGDAALICTFLFSQANIQPSPLYTGSIQCVSP